MRAVAFGLITVLATGCPKSSSTPTPRNVGGAKAPAPVGDVPAISADGSVAVLPAADSGGKVRVVVLEGGHGRAEEVADSDRAADVVAMSALESTGEWSAFSGAGVQITMDEPGRRLLIDVDGARVVEAEAPWWTDPMADQALTHDNGACADESVEIMGAWVAPAQRRVLLVVYVDFPDCQRDGGFYLVGW